MTSFLAHYKLVKCLCHKMISTIFSDSVPLLYKGYVDFIDDTFGILGNSGSCVGHNFNNSYAIINLIIEDLL